MKKQLLIVGVAVALVAGVVGPHVRAADQPGDRAPSAAGRHVRTPAAAPAQAEPERAPQPDRVDAAQCKWIGQRVVMALLRDDVLAADGFQRFYESFDCPVAHLGKVFGCAVPRAGDEVPVQQNYVQLCWNDPNFAAEAATQGVDGAAAGLGTEGTADATATPAATAPADKVKSGEGKKPATTYPK